MKDRASSNSSQWDESWDDRRAEPAGGDGAAHGSGRGGRPTLARRPVVLIAERDEERIAWLRSCLDGDTLELSLVSGTESALAEIARRRPDAVVIGPDVGDTSPGDLAARIAETPVPGGGAGDDDASLIPVFYIADERGDKVGHNLGPGIFYQLDRRMSPEQIQQILASAMERKSEHANDLEGFEQATWLSQILDTVRRFAAERNLAQAADNLERAVARITNTTRASCLFHDPSDGSLWSETNDALSEDNQTASRGLVGFAARTGTPVAVDRVGQDPRYDRAIDDPVGDGGEGLMASPVCAPDGTVHAVLVVVSADGPLGSYSKSSLATLAEHLGPLMHQMALRVEADSLVDEARGDSEADNLFRAEALQAYLSRGKQGDVVRVLPGWVRMIYWPLLGLLVASAVFLVVGRVDQYTSGPAVVQTSGRSEVTANVSGTVVSVTVQAGQQVDRGQVLARLHNASEAEEVERLQAELDTQLRNRMLDPSDAAAAAAVRTLRSAVHSARARLEQRIIRAPSAGTVSDVRIRPGQHLSPGNLVVSLVDDETSLKLVMLLPGADRPQLEPGMLVRLELAGYRYAYQLAAIESVGDEVIGPAEARRYLGGRISDGIMVAGPVVVVEATLSGTTFKADNKIYQYHDGMQGIAEIRVRSKSIIVALIPQLEGI